MWSSSQALRRALFRTLPVLREEKGDVLVRTSAIEFRRSIHKTAFSNRPQRVQLLENYLEGLPLCFAGVVVKGFGRGSKDLGIPTANFSPEAVEKLPKELGCGIYYGLASVNGGVVHKMVMSIGWNPFYKNEKKSAETHILHVFPNDFYGALLKVAVLGFIRPERNFHSLDELITAIEADIQYTENVLEQPQHKLFLTHPFFTDDQHTHSV